MKTFKELAVGDYFIFRDSAGVELEAIKISENNMAYESLDIGWTDRAILLCTDVIVDWFEESVVEDGYVCRCDLYSVIMATGCRCGGK